MSRFVVLLRGVNVGKANRVPMAEFRALLEARGFAAIRTVLNSGNAVFSSSGRSAAAHAKAIRTAIQESLGLGVPVVVKSSAAFLAAAAQNPLAFSEEEHSRVLVVFGQEAGDVQGLSTLQALARPPERLIVGSHAAYLHCPGGGLQSKVAKALLGKAGRSVTTRNWATVLKLEELLHAGLA